MLVADSNHGSLEELNNQVGPLHQSTGEFFANAAGEESIQRTSGYLPALPLGKTVGGRVLEDSTGSELHHESQQFNF